MTNATRQAYEEVKQHIGGRPVWAKCTLGDWLLIDAAEIRDGVMMARCNGRWIMSEDDNTLPAIGEWFVARDFECD